MKQVSLKFNQVQTSTITLVKAIKVKNEKTGKLETVEPAVTEKVETLINTETTPIQYETSDQAVKIAVEIVSEVMNAVKFAKQMEQTSLLLGCQKFYINKKFDLYVSVNGSDYSMDEITNALGMKLSSEFRLSKMELFAKGLLTLLNVADGKSHLLNNTEAKKIESTCKGLLLNA